MDRRSVLLIMSGERLLRVLPSSVKNRSASVALTFFSLALPIRSREWIAPGAPWSAVVAYHRARGGQGWRRPC
jgi:hypothetical protein